MEILTDKVYKTHMHVNTYSIIIIMNLVRLFQYRYSIVFKSVSYVMHKPFPLLNHKLSYWWTSLPPIDCWCRLNYVQTKQQYNNITVSDGNQN